MAIAFKLLRLVWCFYVRRADIWATFSDFQRREDFNSQVLSIENDQNYPKVVITSG